MPRLTEALIGQIPTPNKGIEIKDTAIDGLRLRVTATGFKSWAVLRRLPRGKMIRVTIGSYPAISLASARTKARAIVDKLASGEDPRKGIKLDGVKAMTLAETMEDYLSLRGDRLKANTAAGYRHTLKAELKPLAELRVADIDGEQVVKWHKALNSRSSADKAARVLRAVLRYASDRHGLTGPDGKPATDHLRVLRLMRPPKRKTRVVSDRQAWRRAVDAAPEAVRDLFVVLAATGLRRDELRLAEWPQVDLKAGTVHLPDPKNRKPVTMPLPSQALEILTRRRLDDPKATRVFSNDGQTPVSTNTVSRHVAATSSAMGAAWSPHDLRRTYLSAAASIAPSYVVKKLAHHAAASNDVTEGYVQLDVETLRPWAQKVADLVLGGGQVIDLASRRMS